MIERSSSVATTRSRPRPAEWLAAAVCGAGVAVLAVRSTEVALFAAAVPAAVWVSRRHPLLPVWLLSLEMVLGGWGHLLEIRGVPIRHALLAAVLGAWLVNKAVDGDWRIRGGWHAGGAGLFLGFVAVAVLASVAIGNPSAIEDGLTPFFLLLVFPLMEYASRPGGTLALARCFVIAVFVLSLVQITLTAGIFLGRVDGHWLAAVFDLRIGGVVQLAGPFWRVFIVGSIYYQVVILLLVAGLATRQPLFTTGRDAVVLLSVTFSLLLTYTRGYWVSAIIGLVVLAAITSPRGRVRMTLAALGGLLVLVLVIPATDFAIVDVLWQRLLLTFNPDRDVSVALRLDLYPRLIARIAERPWLGYGFGFPVENQLYYENSYLYYAIKFGFVGLAVLAVSWALLLRDGLRLTRWHPDPHGRAIAAGITAAVVSMLAVTSINPFINSAVGLYFQSLATALVFGVARWPEPDPVPDAQGTGGR